MANEDLLNPGKWSDNLQPMRQDNWFLEFPDVNGNQIPAYTCMSAGRPKLSNEEVEIPFMNNTAYFKGKSKWETLDIVLRTPISEALALRVMEWIMLHHDAESGVDGYKSEYAKDITLKLTSPLGTTIESWRLHQCWITNSDFGSLDMSSADAVEISLTLRFDYAVLELSQ
jgi:hypothetical protein